MTHPSISRIPSLPRALTGAALLLLLAAVPANAALYVILDPTSGPPGTAVTGRTGGEGAFPTQLDPLPAYFVPAAVTASVTSPDDPDLVEIGELIVDAAGNGHISFVVPQIEPGDYAVVIFCPSCAPFSGGQTMAPVADFRVTRSTPATDTVSAGPDGSSAVIIALGMLLFAGVLLAALRLRPGR